MESSAASVIGRDRLPAGASSWVLGCGQVSSELHKAIRPISIDGAHQEPHCVIHDEDGQGPQDGVPQDQARALRMRLMRKSFLMYLDAEELVAAEAAQFSQAVVQELQAALPLVQAALEQQSTAMAAEAVQAYFVGHEVEKAVLNQQLMDQEVVVLQQQVVMLAQQASIAQLQDQLKTERATRELQQLVDQMKLAEANKTLTKMQQELEAHKEEARQQAAAAAEQLAKQRAVMNAQLESQKLHLTKMHQELESFKQVARQQAVAAAAAKAAQLQAEEQLAEAHVVMRAQLSAASKVTPDAKARLGKAHNTIAPASGKLANVEAHKHNGLVKTQSANSNAINGNLTAYVTNADKQSSKVKAQLAKANSVIASMRSQLNHAHKVAAHAHEQLRASEHSRRQTENNMYHQAAHMEWLVQHSMTCMVPVSQKGAGMVAVCSSLLR